MNTGFLLAEAETWSWSLASMGHTYAAKLMRELAAKLRDAEAERKAVRSQSLRAEMRADLAGLHKLIHAEGGV